MSRRFQVGFDLIKVAVEKLAGGRFPCERREADRVRRFVLMRRILPISMIRRLVRGSLWLDCRSAERDPTTMGKKSSAVWWVRTFFFGPSFGWVTFTGWQPRPVTP